MKTKKLIIFVVFIQTLFFSWCTNTSAQKRTDWYIETTKFSKYASKTNGPFKPEYRRDVYNQNTLIFNNFKDSVITIQLFDYDSVGNLVKRTDLTLVKDKVAPGRYNCLDCNYAPNEFKEIVQKIVDRLDNKQFYTPQ